MSGPKECGGFRNLIPCQNHLESSFNLHVFVFIAEMIILWIW